MSSLIGKHIFFEVTVKTPVDDSDNIPMPEYRLSPVKGKVIALSDKKLLVLVPDTGLFVVHRTDII